MLQRLTWLAIIMMSFVSISASTSDTLMEKVIELILEDAQMNMPGNIIEETDPALSNDDQINTPDNIVEEPNPDNQIDTSDNVLGNRNQITWEDYWKVPTSHSEVADPTTNQAYRGWCLNGKGQDVNAGTIRVAASSANGCLAGCRKNQNAKGCEWEANQCVVHTNQVCSGSGKGGGTCWVLKPKPCPKKKSYGGFCVDANGRDVNGGTIPVAASTKDGCVAGCQKNPNAKGCEWSGSECIIHTKQVCAGSGTSSAYSCWVFTNCPAPTDKVSCGHHSASSCSKCTQGHGASWCNGDCSWCNGVCQLKTKDCTGTKQVSCGHHKAVTCSACTQGHGASWCNGDCKWCNGGCHPKAKDCSVKKCNTNNGGCDHICIDKANGKHECKCRAGFNLGKDGKTCSGTPSKPVVTVDDNCKFKCGYTPVNTEVTYEVKWHGKVGGKYEAIKTNGGASLTGPACKYTTVYCTIRYWYPKEPNVKTTVARSEDFTDLKYSITFDKPQVNLKEGGPAQNVKVCLKAPCLNCKRTKVKLNPHAGLSIKPCSIEFTETEKCKTVSVSAMRGYVGGTADTTITPTLDQCTGCKLTVTGLKIRRTKFTGGRKGHCSAAGDPHMRSFDGRSFNHYTVGEYILAKSTARRFEVHARYSKCGGVSCNCGVAVREDDDVLLVTQCGRNTPIAKYVTNRQPQKGTFIEKLNYKYWQIKTRSGAVIKFTAHANWYADINIHVPQEDFGHMVGVCGNFDGSSGNDGRNSESFRLTTATSLHHYTDTGPAVCLNADGCSPDTYQNTPTAGWTMVAAPTCKQQRDEADDEIKNDIAIPSFPTKSGTTENEANAYCKEKLKGSPIYKACNSAIPEGFSADTFVKNCVTDIKIMDDKVDAWEAAMDALVYDCTEIVHDRKLPSTKVDNLVCPDECSGHGTCNKRKCICDEGYGTIDCSEKTGSK